ncbi:hypothetical protein GF352_01800|nr:hypothetical protein [archaeon]
MFTIFEVIDIIITIIAAGYILQPLTRNNKLKHAFAFAGISIVLHELGHKFTALASGFSAAYHANFMGLGFGLLLRFFGLPVFFVPAYVSISGSGSVIGYLLTALAGPLTNLTIYGLSMLLLTRFAHIKWVSDNAEFINALRVINLWLGVINLIPIPGTDGFNALNSLKSL